MTTRHENRHVEVYVRAFEPIRDEHERIVERLERLREDGTIGAFHVRTWPNKVRMSERSICTDILETYDRFADWAAANDVEIHPPFEVRTTGFALLDDHDEVLVLPTMFLTVSEGEDLVGMYPCRTDGTVVRIADCLDALEREHALPAR